MAENLARRLIAEHLIEGEMRPDAEIALKIDQFLLHDGTGPLCATVAPAPLGAEVRPDAEGFVKLPKAGVFESFAQDLSDVEETVLYAAQALTAGVALGGAVIEPAWRSKPSWYVVASNDRAIQPELQRCLASQMGATTIEVAASHGAMLAAPEPTAKLIGDAAA
jgi:pimeloyl-ACP methyl ester carboxylesterase